MSEKLNLRAFRERYGSVSDGFIAEGDDANVHNQTKWFGQHRRVLTTKSNTRLILATKGLSTRAGPENDVGCELFIEFDASNIKNHQIDHWIYLLITLGDLVANGYQVAAVEKDGTILFCTLTDEYNPMTRILLSRDNRRTDILPLGSIQFR